MKIGILPDYRVGFRFQYRINPILFDEMQLVSKELRYNGRSPQMAG